MARSSSTLRTYARVRENRAPLVSIVILCTAYARSHYSLLGAGRHGLRVSTEHGEPRIAFDAFHLKGKCHERFNPTPDSRLRDQGSHILMHPAACRRLAPIRCLFAHNNRGPSVCCKKRSYSLARVSLFLATHGCRLVP